MVHPSRKRRFASGAVAAMMAALFAIPQPALAAGSTPLPTRSPAIGLSAQAQLAASAVAPAVRASAAASQPATASGPDRSSWSFFKSPVGVAVMVGLAIGVGYGVYSTQNDRITSAGKK